MCISNLTVVLSLRFHGVATLTNAISLLFTLFGQLEFISYLECFDLTFLKLSIHCIYDGKLQYYFCYDSVDLRGLNDVCVGRV